ncbi:MAG: sigma-54-dependent Fis family transcriptional regulator [Desulfitobacterium sp.]
MNLSESYLNHDLGTNSQLFTVWSNFIKGHSINLGLVRKVIYDSWCESLENGVDPYQKRVNKLLSAKEATELEKNNIDLIEHSLPIMKKLNKFVAGTGFTVTLTDKNGYILKIIGDQEVINSVSRGNFVVGADWSVESAGTNAIGLALKLDLAIQTISYEHFCICSHGSTCSAAPIHDTNGNIVGVLDMTGESKKAHPHTLGIIVAAVHGIEKQLETKFAWMKYQSAIIHKTAIMESISEGILAVDEALIITHANSCAAKILRREQCNLIGRSLYDFFRVPYLPDLANVTDQEVDIISDQKVRKAIISIRKIEDLLPGMGEWVIIANEIARTKKLVQRMSGAEAKLTFNDIIGQEDNFLSTVGLAKIASHSYSNILLLGESGTGKDVFAQAIHNASNNANGPFIAINCGAIPRELIASELFGYTEGAFTGAKRGGNPGKFEMADGGTIFLDEIGEMPCELQTMLLRVIENKSITRIGGQDAIPVDIRIIAATNRDLLKEVEKGSFRKDLYYRLNVITINLLPLREHKKDIPLLVKKFVHKINSILHKNINNISDSVYQALMDYYWPGNVRELYNVIERAMNLCNGIELTTEALPAEILRTSNKTMNRRAIVSNSFEELEKQLIVDLFEEFNGNITHVAEKLGIARTTLYRKLYKYNLKIN